jgi:GTP pyrophosphokinase
MQDYKQHFASIINNLKNKGIPGISMIEKAFRFAEKKHDGQFRKSGLPYICHPVEVMGILEQLDFGADVLCAALLHDVVEDCGVTIAEIERKFNRVIAQIVDAVTEIKPNEQMENMQAEIKTYQKLVSMGKINRFAFYIKFADRLHNLKTIDTFPRYKQIEKVKQTQKFVIPLLQILKARELYQQVTNECFKVLSWEENYNPYNAVYNQFISTNQPFNQRLIDELFVIVNNLLSKYKIQNTLKNIIITPLTQLEVKTFVEQKFESLALEQIKGTQLCAVPTFNLLFVFSNPDYSSVIFKLLEERVFKSLLKLKSYAYDNFSQKEFFVFENQVRTKFQTFFFSQSQFLIFRNGSEEGTYTSMIEEDFEEEIIADYITVKTRSNEVMLLPKNSTVLDFAFKIHNDFGFSVKYAHLNDSPVKTPIYTKLSDGDKVNLIIEEDANGNTKNIAKLKWLTYVNNAKSKKMLLKYFESLYE